MSQKSRIALVSGTSNPALSKKIADHLDTPLINPQIVEFANGEIFCEIESTVRGADVFLIQSTIAPVNDNLMQLLITIDALKRASAKSINVVMPHYGYSRQDRKASPRSPITAKLVADLITVAGATRVITMDLHSGQIQGFFNIPFDNIYVSPVFMNYINENLYNENTMCISPDSGGVERVKHYAKKLKCELGMVDKRRTGRNVTKAMHIIGDVKGKDCIIIDDIIDTAGTLIEACKGLKKNGAKTVCACITHPVLSNPALERIANSKDLDKLIITDTIPLSIEARKISKITVLPTSTLLAKVILRTYNNESLSSLFIESDV